MPRRYRPPDPGSRMRGPRHRGQRKSGSSVNRNRSQNNAAADQEQQQAASRQRLSHESQHLLHAEIVREGDRPSPAVWSAVGSWLRWRETATDCCCVFCGYALPRTLPAGFIVITTTPNAGSVTAICFWCAALPDDGLLRWAQHLFAARRVDPIHIFNDGGRA